MAAVLTAAYPVLPVSPVWAGIYIAGCVLSSLVMVCSFCAKCPCRNADGGHIIPGRITRYLPPREEGFCSAADLAGVVIPLGFITLLPVIWLLFHPVYLALFVLLLLVAAADIRLVVCRECKNRGYPVCREGCEKKCSA